MKAIKFMDPEIFNFINKQGKPQLLKMKKELEKEIKAGILTDVKYKKELELINSRL